MDNGGRRGVRIWVWVVVVLIALVLYLWLNGAGQNRPSMEGYSALPAPRAEPPSPAPANLAPPP